MAAPSSVCRPAEYRSAMVYRRPTYRRPTCRRPTYRRPTVRRSEGFALLALLTIFVLALSTVLIARVSVNNRDTARQVDNASSLADAVDALMGFAVRQIPPGGLPCPDVTGDGLADPLGSGCQSQRGLFPSRTLGSDVLQDRSGAPLWYAVELAYVTNSVARRNPSRVPALQLDGSPVAAVLIAPGEAFDGQGRTPLNVADFLEGANADADLSAYATLPPTIGNDQLLAVDVGSYWTHASNIAIAEAGRLLEDYRLACGEYPWAAPFGGPFDSTAGLQAGSLPFASALPFDWEDACAGGTAPLPAPWLTTHWADQLYYRFCRMAEGNCLTLLTADGSPAPAARAVLLSPGTPLATQVRPSGLQTNYFEGENVAAPDDRFNDFRLMDHNASYNDVTLSLSP